MSYIDKSSQWSVTQETTYADGATITLPDDIVELVNPTMDASTDLIEREVLKNSLVKAQPIAGKETSSGSMSLELSSVIDGEINGDLLYKSGMGNRIAALVTGVISAGTNTAAVFTPTTSGDADLFVVGQIVTLTGGAGDDVVTTVASIIPDTSVTVTDAPGADDFISLVAVADGGATDGTVFTPVTGTDADDFTVGQAVRLTGGAGVVEYAVVRAVIANTSVTYSPASAVDHVGIEGLLSYTVARPSDAATTLRIQEYFEGFTSGGAANSFEYTYDGCIVSDMTINFPVANIVKADFSVAGAGFSIADLITDSVVDRDAVCHSFDPYVAKNMTFTYDEISYDIEDLSVNVASDVYDVEALTTDGLTNKVITGKSNVGGSFGLEYDGKLLFEAFQSGSTGVLFGTVSNVTSTMGIFAPNVSISQSSKSIDSSIYKDSADFTCMSSETCDATIEDALTIFMA